MQTRAETGTTAGIGPLRIGEVTRGAREVREGRVTTADLPAPPPICEDIIRREDTPSGETFVTIRAGDRRWYADVETRNGSVTVTAAIAGKCFAEATVQEGFENAFTRKNARVKKRDRIAAREAFLRVARAFHNDPHVRGLLNA